MGNGSIGDDDINGTNESDRVRIRIASPEEIRSWSKGEVTRPETYSRTTGKPIDGGLCCERIFGPIQDFTCACGGYDGEKFHDRICRKCGVTVLPSSVRWRRMGHIDLAAPVIHTWFVHGKSRILHQLTGLKQKDLVAIIDHQSHIVLDPAPTGLKVNRVLSDDELRGFREQHGNAFRVATGAVAIEEMLRQLDLQALFTGLLKQQEELLQKVRPPEQRCQRILKRLQVIRWLVKSKTKPEWMVLRCLPVIPPGIRPVVRLDSGRYSAHDLNRLYQLVIEQNNSLMKKIELRMPEDALRDEKRALQWAVDALLDNSCQAGR